MKNGKLVLTPRDREVLSMAGKCQLITPSDVKPLWKGDNKHHFARLRALTADGYLQKVIGDNGVMLGYRITKKGIKELPVAEQARALAIRKVRYRTPYDHDRFCTLAQRIFEKSPLVSGYLCETVVRSQLASRYGKAEDRDYTYKVPDGLFRLTTKKTTYLVGMEVELKIKSEPRYRKILRTQLIQTDFDAVIWLADEEICRYLKELLADVMASDLVVKTSRRRNTIYFADLSEFLEKGAETVFRSEEARFSLAGLERG